MSLTLAMAAFKAGRLNEARKKCEQALKRYPQNWDAYGLLAAIAARMGEMDAAINAYKSGLHIVPSHLEMRSQLASCLFNIGQVDEAVSHWQQILNARTDLIDIRFNLARALLLQGHADEAISQFETIVTLNPTPQALAALGNGLLTVGRNEAAAEIYQVALASNPDDALTRHNLATTWRQLGEAEKADAEYRVVISRGDCWGDRIESAMLLPIVYDNVEQIHLWRNRLVNAIEELHADPIKLNNPLKECEYSDFYLAYQALNNRDIKTTAAAMFKKACSRLDFHAPHCERPRRAHRRIRVGFLSAFFGDHPNGKMVKGYIDQLDRSKFETFVIHVSATGQAAYAKIESSSAILARADHVITVKDDLWQTQEVISKLELDALFYFDIGMHSFSYFLAFARLARVQCSCFGHPETTGIANIDFIISADTWEPDGAESHYSEKILRLHGVGLPAYYYRPFSKTTYPCARSRLNLPNDARLYLCPQTVWKFHPDFDDTIRRILELDPQGLVLCSELKNIWTNKLTARFSRTLGSSAHRVIFLPRQTGDEWASLAASVDVVIDTPHFTGMISTLDVLSVGTPVVTWAGEFARGRQTDGIYKRMGIRECTSNTQLGCADLAIEIAFNGEYRQHISDQISERLPQVFEDGAAISQIEEFLEQVV